MFPAPTPPCNATYPFCQAAVAPRDRVANFLSLATLQEKAGLLYGQGVPRLGVPKLATGEALHGVVADCRGAVCPTSFPSALGLSASFNKSLFFAVGAAISLEARALEPAGSARFAPDVNLFRDPRWGRGQEVPSEDPVLSAKYAEQFVRGMQTGPLYPKYLKTIATCKHWSAYDVENWHGNDRHHFNAIVPIPDLIDYYWVPFKSCVQLGEAASAMCSYNAVNGTPSCANTKYNNGLLRDAWRWGGVTSNSTLSPYIVSDCHAIGDMTADCNCSTPSSKYYHPGHNYSSSDTAAIKDALRGGTDSNCGCYFGKYLPDALAAGLVNESDVDLAAGRLVYAMIRLGQLDAEGASSEYTRVSPSVVDSPAHRQLALEAARQSIVLLKNDALGGGDAGAEKKLLPISTGTSVAFLGPHANATQAMLSNYHGANLLANSQSPLQVAQRRGWSVAYAAGVDGTSSNSSDGIAAAVNAASSSDVAVLFVGLTPCNGWSGAPCNEGESHDRSGVSGEQTDDLGLPGAQLNLVQQVVAANPKTVVVLINGGALGTDWIKVNVPAVIEAFYPGEVGGAALVDVLEGTFDPVGRLPYTVYDRGFGRRRSMTDMSLRSGQGITHLHYTGTPLWRFGDGLSYSSVHFDWETRAAERQDAPGALPSALGVAELLAEAALPTLRVRIRNNGTRATSGTSVLAFVSSSDPGFPLQRLFAFAAAPALSPGEEAVVEIPLPTAETLAVSDWSGRRVVTPADLLLRVGQQHQWLEHSLTLTGSAAITEDYSALFR